MSKRRNEQQICIKDGTIIDWSKCFMCQEDTNEKLQCSFKASKPDQDKIKATYTNLAERMLAFQKEGIMLISVNFDALTKGS